MSHFLYYLLWGFYFELIDSSNSINPSKSIKVNIGLAWIIFINRQPHSKYTPLEKQLKTYLMSAPIS